MWVLDVPRKDGTFCLLSAPTSFATEERLNAALEDVSGMYLIAFSTGAPW